MRILSLFMALAMLVPGVSPAQTSVSRPRTIPAAEFAKNPLVSNPLISPDGQRLVGRFYSGGKELIGIHSFTGEKIILMELPPKRDLRWFRWAGNDRILMSFAQTVPFFGDEAQSTRLLCYEISTRTIRFIGSKNEGLEGDDLLYVDPTGSWILLSFQKSIYDYPSVSRIDLATNKAEQVVSDRPDVWEWYADKDGVVRIGVGFTERSWSMVYRSSVSEKFRKVGTAKYGDENSGFDIIRVAVGTDEGYVLSNKATGRFALYKFNYATKQLGELVYGSATNDITDYDIADDGKSLRAVWYADDRDRIVWFDPKMKQFQIEIDAALKQNQNWILSRSRADDAMLVWTGASNNPGGIYLYRPAAGVMTRIARVSETLGPNDLAPTKYMTYKTRDGLDIPAYLTLPVGREAKGLPLIILPHGGPYGVRDKLEYNAEVQFLANRGYAVLQPNFRGSGGYGEKFYEKGEGQWGRQMQDDLDDGMDWLTKEGVVDPKRVCIVGSSYGGYAALWGATRNPERYRCAASFAGVSA